MMETIALTYAAISRPHESRICTTLCLMINADCTRVAVAFHLVSYRYYVGVSDDGKVKLLLQWPG